MIAPMAAELYEQASRIRGTAVGFDPDGPAFRAVIHAAELLEQRARDIDPDPPHRNATARLVGQLAELATVLRGLPLDDLPEWHHVEVSYWPGDQVTPLVVAFVRPGSSGGPLHAMAAWAAHLEHLEFPQVSKRGQARDVKENTAALMMTGWIGAVRVRLHCLTTPRETYPASLEELHAAAADEGKIGRKAARTRRNAPPESGPPFADDLTDVDPEETGEPVGATWSADA